MNDLHLHSKKPGVAIITSANPLDKMEIHRISRSEWKDTPDEPGVYLLYGNPEGQLTAYVGMSTTSIKKRIASHHVNKKKNWFGILFAMPLPLATICPAVETELIYMIREARVVDIVDNRSSEKRMQGLEDYQVSHAVEALVSALELILGQDIFTIQEQEKVTLGPTLSRSVSKTTLKDILGHGLLQEGQEIVFARNNINARAIISKTGDIVLDSKSYSTPSAAASKAYGAKSGINGWRDWKTISGQSLLDLREELERSVANKPIANTRVVKTAKTPSRTKATSRGSTPRKRAKTSSTSIKDLLDAQLIKPGETLYCMWDNRADKGEVARVMADESIQTTDGQVFASPSSAAAHLRGGATNGWCFWGVETTPNNKAIIDTLRKQFEDSHKST